MRKTILMMKEMAYFDQPLQGRGRERVKSLLDALLRFRQRYSIADDVLVVGYAAMKEWQLVKYLPWEAHISLVTDSNFPADVVFFEVPKGEK